MWVASNAPRDLKSCPLTHRTSRWVGCGAFVMFWPLTITGTRGALARRQLVPRTTSTWHNRLSSLRELYFFAPVVLPGNLGNLRPLSLSTHAPLYSIRVSVLCCVTSVVSVWPREIKSTVPHHVVICSARLPSESRSALENPHCSSRKQ